MKTSTASSTADRSKIGSQKENPPSASPKQIVWLTLYAPWYGVVGCTFMACAGSELPPRVLQTCNAAKAVVPRNRSLRKSPSQPKLIYLGSIRSTYHSKAPKTVPAIDSPHTFPCRDVHPTLPRRSASAMKPANQKSIVTDSATRTAYLCAAVANLRGAMTR